MTQKIYPRSPYLTLGGYIHLPRLIDKARLSRQGSLHGYNYKTLGFDKHLLSFLGIDGDQFEDAANNLESDQAILDWVCSHGVPRSWLGFDEFCKKSEAARNRVWRRIST